MFLKGKISFAIVVILIVFTNAGCATVFTQVGFHKFPKIDLRASELCGIPQFRTYSGTLFVLRSILTPFICDMGGESGMIFMGFYPCLAAGCIIDLPLSIAADTLILPYTAFQQIAHRNDIYDYLNCIWGTSAENMYIAGDKGSLFHFNGQKWKQIKTGTDNNLNAIWGSSESNIFVVGDGNTILHFNGEKWSTLEAHNHNASDNYKDVFGFSNDKVFVLSEYGTVLLFNGKDWSALRDIFPAKEQAKVNSLWGESPDNIFFAGSSLYHYNHNRLPPTTVFPVSGTIFDISGISDSIYCVSTDGAIYMYENNQWNISRHKSDKQPFHDLLYSLWGTSTSNLFVVGSDGLILHGDGISWEKMQSGTELSLRSVWGSDENHIYAVGELGTILRYDGRQWYQLQ